LGQDSDRSWQRTGSKPASLEPAVRIGQLIESIPASSGGTTTAFLGTLSALEAAGADHWLALTLRPAPDDPAWARINAAPDRWRLASSAGKLRPGDLARLATDVIRAGEIDVLHIHGLWCADHLPAAAACARAGVGLVWEPHGMLMGEAMARGALKKRAFLALGGARALRTAGSLLFVTAEERDHSVLPRGIGPDRRDVVPLAVEGPHEPIDAARRSAARAWAGLPPGAPVIAFMGRLHPVKRIELLFEAFALVKDREARLLIAGGGDDEYARSLRARAAELGLGERVSWTGWVRGEDKWRVLACADALSLQSVHENFGFVAVEALLAGAMPVLTDNLALSGELAGAELAIVTPPAPDALAAGLQRALDGRDAPGLLARGGAYVGEHYSPAAVGRRLMTIYQRVASPAHASGARA
jgi:glycosyltransferase involved in cell wall biosynthesis